jgi:glycerol-3-phosphate O-acyltransferase
MELLKFIYKFLTKGSNISVSIGQALDVIGNYVDEDGNSIDAKGKTIETKDYFRSNGQITEDIQREGEYTRLLAGKIVQEYHSINRVFASHLTAFIAFEMFQRMHPKLDLFGLLRLPEEDLEIPYDQFRETFKKLRKEIFHLKEAGKINFASHLKGNVDEVIKRGIENVGIFHLKQPVRFNKAGNIITQDLNLLYYYHNRLAGYDLERLF